MRACLFFVTALTSLSLAIEATSAVPALREGDKVTLTMGGDVAKQYMKKTVGKDDVSSDLKVSIMAEVAQRFPDGRIRVETVEPLKSEGKEDRLLTISAVVSPKNITTTTIPKGTPVFAAPADMKALKAGQSPHVAAEDSTQSTVSLAELKGVAIRTWVLEQD